jgi:2-(1,2-epoxy-1,2-dihydrophenyl)acetyl-CoA isomerase
MEYETILFDVADGVARITLNDPATLNAFSRRMGEELQDAFACIEADLGVRAALLTGAGRGFCSGANLAARGQQFAEGAPVDTGALLEAFINPMVLAAAGRRVPLVTAVNGPAAGVGLSLALLGDIIVAAESAFFLLAFTRIGLVPDGGASWLLPRRIGLTRASEMALLAERVPASQALAWGLVNRVVANAELGVVAWDLARRLAAGPGSLSVTRRMMFTGLENSLEAQLDLELAEQRRAGRTEDYREGVAAFLEKRAAVFVGR